MFSAVSSRRQLTVSALWDLWVANDGKMERLRAQFDDIDIEPMVKPWHDGDARPVERLGQGHGGSLPRRGATADPRGEGVHALAAHADCAYHLDRRYDRRRAGHRSEARAGNAPVHEVARRAGTCSLGRSDARRRAAAAGRSRASTTSRPPTRSAWPRRSRRRSASSRRCSPDPASKSRSRSRCAGATSTKNREIRAAGTKTHARDRIVRVADWAWEYVEPLLKGRHADALLFDTIPHRWEPQDAHTDAVNVAHGQGPRDLRGLHDARPPAHVRRAGHSRGHAGGARRAAARPRERCARPQGLRALLAQPGERDKWEKIAAAQDDAAAEKAKEAVRMTGTMSGRPSAFVHAALCRTMPRTSSINGGDARKLLQENTRPLSHNAGVVGSSPTPATLLDNAQVPSASADRSLARLLLWVVGGACGTMGGRA
jgi:hypothetical protein